MSKEEKRVPEVRFEGFHDDWKQRKLGAITDSFSGGTPTAGKAEYYGGEIPFIRSGETSSDSTELFITDAGLNNSSAKMVGIGDILYALYGATSGETSISRINGAINQAILAIRPTKGDDPYMIVQWLKKQKETIISTYLQGGQGNLSGSIVKDLLITLPKNKDEQAKVGSFFKQLDQTITLHQEKLSKLQSLKKATLQSLFPKNEKLMPEVRFNNFKEKWLHRKLGEILKSHTSKPYLADPTEKGAYQVIQQGDEPVAGYADNKPFEDYNGVTLFGDHTVSLYKPVAPFLLATDGVKILSAEGFCGEFLYTLLERYKPISQGYKRHFKSFKKPRYFIPQKQKRTV
ncbi:type I restriction-modification system, specificity subunit S [Tetragenococcus muriaticus PMC-11-5]|uniref:Type I restriction-modification system, specificity subunit S n=1 Tax=Tetragenococcus muriaticus PMC-11-5 TaxID=1302649 RepID=A0A091C3C9_9ENTE|nr:restriction endonuclease subunit S [Tetragenococcus muriaticus]KFN90592.1 type I restriction-modification system, specificity subunit S [Tetragenococcus muriaticus PMC-11-5]